MAVQRRRQRRWPKSTVDYVSRKLRFKSTGITSVNYDGFTSVSFDCVQYDYGKSLFENIAVNVAKLTTRPRNFNRYWFYVEQPLETYFRARPPPVRRDVLNARCEKTRKKIDYYTRTRRMTIFCRPKRRRNSGRVRPPFYNVHVWLDVK